MGKVYHVLCGHCLYFCCCVHGNPYIVIVNVAKIFRGDVVLFPVLAICFTNLAKVVGVCVAELCWALAVHFVKRPRER